MHVPNLYGTYQVGNRLFLNDQSRSYFIGIIFAVLFFIGLILIEPNSIQKQEI